MAMTLCGRSRAGWMTRLRAADDGDVTSPRMRWLGSLFVFILVLAVMKYFFGWPISIGGSLVLSLILTGVFSLFNRR